jgi:hypothetical protein
MNFAGEGGSEGKISVVRLFPEGGRGRSFQQVGEGAK